MGLNVFTEYATNEKAEIEGTIMEVGEAKLTIARIGNKKYSRKLSKLYERNRKLLERKDDSADALSDKIMIEVLSETILLGWEGIDDEDGKPMPYSKENAVKLLGLKDFRKVIMELAGDDAEFKAHKDVEVGND
jgi:hypothetical protein